MRVNLLATRFFAPNYKTRLNDEPEPTTETTTTTNQQHLSSNDLMSSQSANKDVAFKGAVINEFIAGRATAEELAHKFVAIIPDIQAKLKLMAPENTVEIHSTLAPLREIFSDVSSHPGDIIDAFIQRTDLYEKVYKEALKVRAYRQPTPTNYLTSTLLNGIYTLTEKAGARARASFSKVIFEHGEEIANQVSEYSKIPAQSVYWHIAKFAPEAAVKIKNQDFAKRSGYQALYRIFTNPNIAITDKMALIARGVEDTADWMKIINEIEGTNLSLRSQH